MREPGEVVSAAFPRPGRVLKAVLVVMGAFAILGAVVWNWAPGPPRGEEIFSWVALQPHPIRGLLVKPWTLITSGVLTWPKGYSHALWSMVGLYFLGTDLEKRWGGATFLKFLAGSVLIGNLTVLAVDQLPIAMNPMANPEAYVGFHPPLALGPLAAITATAVAWAKENSTRQIRLFFFLPVSGRALFWFTIAFTMLSPLFLQGAPEGIAAPFGGIIAGLVFGGMPSPARSAWLRLKLLLLRRKGHALTVESMMGEPSSSRRAPKRPAKGGPALRVVQGGAEDDLKNRKPPKDKRYLN